MGDKLARGPGDKGDSGPNSKGNRRPDDWLGRTHLRVSGLGRREPGSGVQVRVQVQGLNFTPVPAPVPDNPYQSPEGRDLRPENALPLALRASGPPVLQSNNPRLINIVNADEAEAAVGRGVGDG